MERSYLLDSECGKRLYRRILGSVVGEVARFSEGESASDTRNLYRALLTENGKRLLTFSATEAHFLSDSYSDYENLEELIALLPSLVGSGYHSFVRLFLECLLDFRKPPTPSDAYALWRASLPLLEDESLARLFEPFSDKRVVDMTSWLFPSAIALRECETVDAYLSAFREQVEKTDLLWLDLSGFTFASPDPYHAQKSFFAIRNGEGDDRDRDFFASQLLRVTGETCKTRNIPLVLSGKASSDGLKTLFAYLKRVDRMPRAFLSVPFESAARLEALLSELDSSGILSLFCGIVPSGLSIGSAASIKESLTLLATRYPVGRLAFVAESRTDIEACMEYECFLRLLSELLASSVQLGEISEPDAVTVGTNVLSAAIR